MSTNWFDVDKEGLAKLLRRKGMKFVLYELIQNAWDSGAGTVTVTIEPVPGQPLATLVVTDDSPEGFKNLSHAYTLFAESDKKSDPTKRGRFNLGEKLVLAVCKEAEIRTTKGVVHFDAEGRAWSNQIASRLDKGSTFKATIRMTRAEMDEVTAAADDLLPPMKTVVNGKEIANRTPLKSFEVTLPTEIADEEGFLRRSARKTEVRVYDRKGAMSSLFELGIPVVEIDDPWDIEVMQKVPLNADRDNVTPAYMREVRVHVVNEMHKYLKPEDAATPAVQDALTDERIKAEAVETVLTQQYGDKRAVYDPSDPEANRRLIAEGFTIITGGAFSKNAWKNIRTSGAALPAGQLSPTPKPYSSDPDAKAARFIPEEEWSKGMHNIAGYVHELAWKLMHTDINVRFEKGRMTDPWGANFGHGELTFNHDRLGKAWFDQGPCEIVNDLILHEFGHHYEGNHLSDGFYKALTKLGAKLWALAMKEPEFFKKYGAK